MVAGRPDAGDGHKTVKVFGKPSRNSSVGALDKSVRLRDKEHRKFVSRQGCLVCGRTPSDPHHLSFVQPRALGHRVSDEFTVQFVGSITASSIARVTRPRGEARLSIDPVSVAFKL